MSKTFKKQIKLKAQAIIEGSAAFLLVFLIFMFIAEFALYFQSIHSNQTLSDDINANISSYAENLSDEESFCAEPDSDVIARIENRAKKYLDNNIELDIDIKNNDILILKSKKNNLTINILCSRDEGYIVRSEYLFRGFFLFRFGSLISGISSVQTPKF